MPNAQSNTLDLGQRLQALALIEYGVPPKVAAEMSGMSKQSVSRLKIQAVARGYNKSESTILKLDDVTDGVRSGRSGITAEKEKEVLDAMENGDRNHREKPSGLLAHEHTLSPSSIQRILKRNNYRSCKKQAKPGLTEEMQKAQLDFCLAHQHWTFEDWKDVIWTDETSVMLGARRGMRLRVWRRPWEAYDKKVVKTRYKRNSEFMFWGCYSYDCKGPMHIWDKESAHEKKEAAAFIDKINQALEPLALAKWQRKEAKKDAERVGQRKGRRAVWKWDSRHLKIVRGGKGGIDWIRYQNKILLPKLFPFAIKCRETRAGTVVIEDGAPRHISKHQARAWRSAEVIRSFWPGNSPDLNMIETCWAWMKRETSRKGAPADRKTAKKVWSKCWKRLGQLRIQRWIERIPRHIQEVIELEGGNNYREGIQIGLVRPYDKEERKNRYTREAGGQFREDHRFESDSPLSPATPLPIVDIQMLQAEMLANISDLLKETPSKGQAPDQLSDIVDDYEDDEEDESGIVDVCGTDDDSDAGENERGGTGPGPRERSLDLDVLDKALRQYEAEIPLVTEPPAPVKPQRSRYGRALCPSARRQFP